MYWHSFELRIVAKDLNSSKKALRKAYTLELTEEKEIEK